MASVETRLSALEETMKKLEEERAKIMIQIIEALEGDAQRIARDIGIPTLRGQDGLPRPLQISTWLNKKIIFSWYLAGPFI